MIFTSLAAARIYALVAEPGVDRDRPSGGQFDLSISGPTYAARARCLLVTRTLARRGAVNTEEENHLEYGKIDTLLERNEDFSVDSSRLKSPVIATISSWTVSEKIDGTNMRATLIEGESKVKIDGRTDKASIPGDLFRHMTDTFEAAKIQAVMDLKGAGWERVVLYGEGYGAGIQKGGTYRNSKAFRLFDVLVADKWWLSWDAVEQIAADLGIKTAPNLGIWTLPEIIDRVRAGVRSVVAVEEGGLDGLIAEGVVARPIETLFDKKGHRLIIKLKTKDFVAGKR